jgi:hypothetical protein
VVDDDLTPSGDYVRLNIMRVARLQNALDRLTAAMRDVASELAAMEAEHDPLASHIFISRPPLSERQRHKGRKATRDKHSLRTWLSREFG